MLRTVEESKVDSGFVLAHPGVGPIDPVLAEISIPALFEQQVDRSASRIAISSGPALLRYEELESRANRLAHAILARGGEPSGCTALLIEQGVGLPIAVLGALKAGQSFVPLDPSYPEARLAHMLTDSGATRIVTSTRHAERAEAILGSPIETVLLDRDCETYSDDRPSLDVAPDQIAYLLYTSGSTGLPKGVVQDHRSVVHNMLRHRSAWGITPEDRQSQLYPCSVYGGTRDLFNALLNGAGLYHFPLRQDGFLGLADWLDEHRITIYCSVASVFRHFAHELEGSDLFPHLRWVKLGGEAPHRRDVELFQTHFSRSTRMMCGLGSTETGMSRFLPIDRDTVLDGSSVPLGYPVDGVEIELIGEDGRPVAPGEVGEIVIRSRYVMRGYHGREDLNRQVLHSDPADPSVRRLTTGDLGRVDEDGLLSHMGRKDHLVKIRGNRVELREIEAALAECPGVRDAAVVARSEGEGDVYLLAYLVAEGDAPPRASAVRSGLRERLPSFMVPRTFVAIDRLPQMPNGKIDRSALPEPATLRSLFASSSTPPVNATQRALLPIWRRLLQNEEIGIDDSYFDLGGDSLSIVHMLVEVEQELGQTLALGELTAEPTIRTVAAAIDGEPVPGGVPGVVRFGGGGSLPPLFCLPGRGGTVFCYRGVAQRIGHQRPVFGLPLPGLGGGTDAPIDRVEDLAEEMMRRVDSVAPDGPVDLIGYSFGGIVAYEMARLWRERGRPIPYVGLIDATAPGAIALKPFSERAWIRARRFLGASWPERVRDLQRQARRWSRSRRPLPTTLEAPEDDPTLGGTGAAALAIERTRSAMREARSQYRPPAHAGRICLLRCDDRPGWTRHVVLDPLYGWGGVATGGVDVYEIPGPHGRIFHPFNLEALARQVAASLAAGEPAVRDAG